MTGGTLRWAAKKQIAQLAAGAGAFGFPGVFCVGEPTQNGHVSPPVLEFEVFCPDGSDTAPGICTIPRRCPGTMTLSHSA